MSHLFPLILQHCYCRSVLMSAFLQATKRLKSRLKRTKLVCMYVRRCLVWLLQVNSAQGVLGICKGPSNCWCVVVYLAMIVVKCCNNLSCRCVHTPPWLMSYLVECMYGLVWCVRLSGACIWDECRMKLNHPSPSVLVAVIATPHTHSWSDHVAVCSFVAMCTYMLV